MAADDMVGSSSRRNDGSYMLQAATGGRWGGLQGSSCYFFCAWMQPSSFLWLSCIWCTLTDRPSEWNQHIFWVHSIDRLIRPFNFRQSSYICASMLRPTLNLWYRKKVTLEKDKCRCRCSEAADASANSWNSKGQSSTERVNKIIHYKIANIHSFSLEPIQIHIPCCCIIHPDNTNNSHLRFRNKRRSFTMSTAVSSS
jgi:hypothetical protein